MRVCLTLFLLLTISAQSQTMNVQEMSKTVTAYFSEPRESIFLHLNKNQALTGEEIWYKGYITERKSRKPFTGTSNVYVSLVNAKGEKISSHVNFADASLFTGRIKIDANLPTGKYYIMAYTNFMNNFEQDESSRFPVFVINPTDGKLFNDAKVNYKNAALSLFPESGKIIADVVNTIGVKLVDCDNKGFSAEGKLKDQDGRELLSFTTNDQGYARFSYRPVAGKNYTVSCMKGSLEYKQQLPYAAADGVVLSVNNHTSPGRAIISLSTNEATLEKHQGEAFTIIVSQLDQLVQIAIPLTELQNQILVKGDYFTDGFNQVRLLDKDLKLAAERVIYKPFGTIKSLEILESTIKNDTLSFRAQAGVPLANLSLSILPAKTTSTGSYFPSSVSLDGFLTEPVQNAEYYLANFNRQKHFELDTYLMCQKPRYRWENITAASPPLKYEFERGLTMKGNINSKLKNPEDHTATLILNGEFIEAPVSAKGEFVYENLMVMDSTATSVSIVDRKGLPTNAPVYFQVLNNKRPFMKSNRETPEDCLLNAIETIVDGKELPGKQQKMIFLDEVAVKYAKTPALTKQFAFGNSMADGYKVTDEAANRYRTLLDFIATQGFVVNSYSGTVDITLARNQGSQQPRPPAIYLDDIQTFDFNMLRTYMFREFDEVYINRNAILGTTAGSIRLYLKKGPRSVKRSNATSQPYMIKEGYQFTGKYKNPLYTDLHSIGFLEYGSIDWVPNINTDDYGYFSIKVPALSQKSFILNIQGITADGQAFTEEKLLTVP
ncbi:MAG: hypothetical protein EOO01_05160 [Chitinophagaceae bacterium]|nr:MAG: hypothetical protein EOO01_05160 [Chitinophagaceae bacterium]